jgi:hypothetical protein
MSTLNLPPDPPVPRILVCLGASEHDGSRVFDVRRPEPGPQGVGIVRAAVPSPSLAGEVVAEVEGETVGRHELCAYPVGQHVRVLCPLQLLDRARVPIERRVDLGEGRYAQRRLVEQREIDHGLTQPLLVAADPQLGGGPEALQIGLLGDDVERTGGGVATAQRPLGTAVDLHPLQIEEHGSHPSRARDVDPVDVGGRGGISELGVVVRADPADVDLDVALLHADLDRRHHAGDRLDRFHPELVQIRLGEGVGRSRVALDALLSAVRGDGHGFDGGAILDLLLRHQVSVRGDLLVLGCGRQPRHEDEAHLQDRGHKASGSGQAKGSSGSHFERSL